MASQPWMSAWPLSQWLAAMLQRPTASDLLLSLALLGLFTLLSVPTGLASGFLRPTRALPPPALLGQRALALLLMPSLVEELLFRVTLLPRGLSLPAPSLGAWLALSLGLFVAYHPLAARLWYPPGRSLFRDARFLIPCTWLGLACGLAYLFSASLWPPLLLHWVVVLVWLELLGGRSRLEGRGHRGA
ncbi:MAG: CPBP family glutamic-type intramembrane protease [Synechococcaceae cyanobacterium]|nr:CPBP family glutamic-type intramembrane protease [Synechococcaceae cyanobacterium]